MATKKNMFISPSKSDMIWHTMVHKKIKKFPSKPSLLFD